MSYASRRTEFTYHTSGAAAGQLWTVTHPADNEGTRPYETLEYDALGNLRKTRSPLGQLSLVYRDALGRDTVVITPTNAATAGDSAALYNGGGAR